MSNRAFYGLLILIALGFVGFYSASKHTKHVSALVGVVTHSGQGENHIQEGAAHPPYNSELPSSGQHYADASAPAQWGVYTQELQAEVFLHNEEHGGVIIAYKPDLPAAQIQKLQKLFAQPSSDKTFSPGKFILIPRAENKYPIELAAWRRTFYLSAYDQSKIEQFYLQNVSNKLAPESFGGPTNKPINEATQ